MRVRAADELLMGTPTVCLVASAFHLLLFSHLLQSQQSFACMKKIVRIRINVKGTLQVIEQCGGNFHAWQTCLYITLFCPLSSAAMLADVRHLCSLTSTL